MVKERSYLMYIDPELEKQVKYILEKRKVMSPSPNEWGELSQVNAIDKLIIGDRLEISPQARQTILRGYSDTSGTSLPGTPMDGQLYDYVADSTDGVVWRFRYRAASASTYKWEFVGGSPLTEIVASNESTSSTSYTDLATAGPSITVPLAGDYIISQYVDINVDSVYHFSSPKIGSAATADANRVQMGSAAGIDRMSASRIGLLKTLAANDVIKLQYRVGSGTGTWDNRTLVIEPRRVI